MYQPKDRNGTTHGVETMKIVLYGPFNSGSEPATFQSQVQRSTELSARAHLKYGNGKCLVVW